MRCTGTPASAEDPCTCELRVDYGTAVDMSTTPLGLVLRTDEFPRD
ncbi:hypothetical protein ACIQMV_23930 [Streptomyces sp. NPDC091412]